MKKMSFLLLVASTMLQAQVPNGSFEEYTGNTNETRFWGASPQTLQVIFNPDGTSTVVGDNIILEEGITSRAFYTNEAQTGERAMEIRNAFNVTKNEVVPGKMVLFNEDQGATTANNWNLGTQVTPETVLEGLGFHYKYFPLNPTDQAQATLEAYDANGYLVGTATVIISGTASNYVYTAAPLVLASNEVPAYITVEFSMATPDGSSTFGNRLIIDDVVTSNLVLNTPSITTRAFTVSPTLTHCTLNITKGSTLAAGDYAFTITNMEGKEVQKTVLAITDAITTSVDVSALATGVYVIATDGFRAKFIKK